MKLSGQLHDLAALPPEKNPGTHWIGGRVGPTVGLDAVVKRKIPTPLRESNPRTPIVKPVAQSLYRLSYHGSYYKISEKDKFRRAWKYAVVSSLRSY
jgi:hypothetical protein